MSTCPNCGAKNDPANRFCDQCGTRIEAAAPTAAATDAATASADMPTMLAPTVCPSCGSPILPGEAFCDNCGADLTAVAAPAAVAAAPADPAAPAASADAPTATAAPASGVCPNCGAPVLPGEAFCDNCGADLAAAAASAPTPQGTVAAASAAPASNDAATVLAPPAPVPAPAPSEAAAAPSVTPAEPAMSLPPAEAAAPAAEAAPVAAPAAEAAPIPAPAVEAAATPAAEAAPVPAPAAEAAPAAGGDYGARKAALESEIDRQRQIVTQFEQMQATFGAAAPAAVATGLAEARDALARAEAELGALTPPAPAVDPAELQRLQGEIDRQRQIVTQFEQMQATFGAAAPAAVATGLAEARDALARAETELAALGGAAPAQDAAAPAAVAPAPAPAAAPAAAAPAPAAAGPRFVVVDGGQELRLPADKAEIIVGREDPVSNIFPEVDLTAFGGEMGGVSRQHARLNQSGGQWTITDLNSTNHTRVDGARVEPGVATPLHDGARVQFGRVVLTFHV
jgi:uncharacterized OB-fold protein